MPIVQDYRAGFVGGEIEEGLLSRADLALFAKGLKRARNVYIDTIGTARRREGTQYFNPTITGTGKSRLIPFSFNTAQNYLLEFSAATFRVYKELASSFLTTANISDSDLSVLNATTIESMWYAQSSDTLLLANAEFATLQITRTSDAAWTVVPAPFTNIPLFPFSAVTLTNPAATLTPSSTLGKITLTAGSAVFSAGNVNQIILINNGTVRITEYVSTTVVKGNVVTTLTGTTAAASGDWTLESGYEPVWSSTRGWPKTIVFFQNRLFVGGSKSRPQTIWGSKIGDFFNFDEGTGRDDEAFSRDIDDDQVNSIVGLHPVRNLQIFTTGGEFYIPRNENAGITPNNFRISQATRNGCNGTRPINIDGSTIFVEAGANVIREFIYDAAEESFNAPGVSDFAPHLVRKPTRSAVRGATAEFPVNSAYFVNSDGTVLNMNIRRDKDVLALSLLEFPQGSVVDIAAVGCKVVLQILRTINGAPTYYLEFLDVSRFLDCSITDTSVTAKTVWTGYNALNGLTVMPKGDGVKFEPRVVSGGTITLDYAVSSVEMGVFFSPLVETSPVGAALSGTWRRPVEASIKCINTRNMLVQSGRRVYRPSFRSFTLNNLNTPPPLFTGWKRLFLSGIDRDPTLTIYQDAPMEFSIAAINLNIYGSTPDTRESQA